jgi:hypothetical protein
MSSNIKCPPKRRKNRRDKSPMEVVLLLVLEKIRIDKEIPWDVHSLLWNATAREATLRGASGSNCGTTMQAVTAIGSCSARQFWAKSCRKAPNDQEGA